MTNETLPHYEDYPALKPLKRLVIDYLAVSAAMKELEARKREIIDTILPAMNKAQVEAVMVGDEPVRVVTPSPQKRLDKTRLLELVSPETVAFATIEVPRAQYLVIGKKNEENRRKYAEEG